MINTVEVLNVYSKLEQNGTWLTDEQVEYSGVGYRINHPLRYIKHDNYIALECHESDLSEITESTNGLEGMEIAIKQGNTVFAVFVDNKAVNWLIESMELYLQDDE